MSFSRCEVLVGVPFRNLESRQSLETSKTSMEKQSEAGWRPPKDSSCASCHRRGRVLERVSSYVTGRGVSSLVRQLPLAAVFGRMKAQLAPRPSPELAVCLALGGVPSRCPHCQAKWTRWGQRDSQSGVEPVATRKEPCSRVRGDTNTGSRQADRRATQFLACARMTVHPQTSQATPCRCAV